MSGLCGVLYGDGGPDASTTLARMMEAAADRGPDGRGAWTGDGVGLAHLSLQVTAEEARDAQPLRRHDLVLVADARIDNRSSLISTLRRILPTSTPTDAELILAAYRRWGADCAAHLIGDFAFALWDQRERRLFAARDPMAMRGFHYRVEEDRVLFATDVAQILAAPGVPSRLYSPMVAAYLAGNFEDLTHTMYEGIRALPPAHAMTVTPDGVRTWEYWTLDPTARIRYEDDRDYVAHFRALFTEAVRARLRSAHPVGLMLSGGLDSGSIASTAGALQERGKGGGGPLRTYSFSFPSFPQSDERFISDQIVERYGLAATTIDAEAAPLLSWRPYVGPDRDDPYVLGFHGINERVLQQAEADGVRCLLTGHRGDLVVGGWIFDYLRLFRTGRWRYLWRELKRAEEKTGVPWPRAVQIYLIEPLRAMFWPPGRADWIRTPLKRMYRGWRPAPPPESPFPDWVHSDFAARHAQLLSPLQAPDSVRDPMRRWRYESLLMPAHMRGAALTERHAARHGIVTADPWSDRRLIEFAAAVPPDVLSRHGENKWILREAMRGLMPEAARTAARKIDPSPLYAHALKVTLSPLIQDVLSNMHSVSGTEQMPPVNISRLHDYYKMHQKGNDEDDRFWYTLTFAMWLQQHHESPSFLSTVRTSQ